MRHPTDVSMAGGAGKLQTGLGVCIYQEMAVPLLPQLSTWPLFEAQGKLTNDSTAPSAGLA
jgi:hypothetical protein